MERIDLATWGRNDLERADIGAKGLGANRLEGETTCIPRIPGFLQSSEVTGFELGILQGYKLQYDKHVFSTGGYRYSME